MNNKPLYAIILIDMNRMYTGGPVYEASSPVDRWLKIFLAAIVVIVAGFAASTIRTDITGTWSLLGIAVFLGLLFYFILPKKYQVYEDRIRIAFGGPFTVSVPFSSINEIRPLTEISRFSYSGVRLATNSKNMLEIVRKQGPGMIISPENRDSFIQQVNRAMANYAKTKPDLRNKIQDL